MILKTTYIFKTVVAPFVLIYSLLVTGYCYAEISVIVHPSNEVSLSKKNVQRIFLGKMKKFPGGGEALPINLPVGNVVAERFNSTVLKKSAPMLSGYWGQYVFTGKGAPPKQVDSVAAVKNLVELNPSAIGYVDSELVDDTVKAIYKF